MENIKKRFGLRIKELRLAKSWTQEYLAEKLNMETQNISRLEKGVHLPNSERIEQLAKIFSVDVCELFMFEHFNERDVLIKKITEYLEKASQKELQFIYKVITACKEK